MCFDFRKIMHNDTLMRHNDSFLNIHNLAAVDEDHTKAPFSIATIPRYRGGHYSFAWIGPLYP